MADVAIEVRVEVKKAFWIMPLLYALSFAQKLGFPIDKEKVREFVKKHGIKVYTNGRRARWSNAKR